MLNLLHKKSAALLVPKLLMKIYHYYLNIVLFSTFFFTWYSKPFSSLNFIILCCCSNLISQLESTLPSYLLLNILLSCFLHNPHLFHVNLHHEKGLRWNSEGDIWGTLLKFQDNKMYLNTHTMTNDSDPWNGFVKCGVKSILGKAHSNSDLATKWQVNSIVNNSIREQWALIPSTFQGDLRNLIMWRQ